MVPTCSRHQSISTTFKYFFVILSLLLLIAGVFPAGAVAQVLSGTWSATGSMASVRSGASAALLQDGSVLITGGTDASGPLEMLRYIADHSRQLLPCSWRAATTRRSRCKTVGCWFSVGPQP